MAINAVSVLGAVDDMYQIGRAIGAEDPCNPANIIETLAELVTELIVDFIDGIIKLAGIAGKNSLFLILAILQETYGPSILLGITGTVGFLTGNLIGTVMQAMAMVMAQVDGIKMILMYLAAGATMSALQQRQGFITMYMMNVIDHIIHVLQLLDQLQYTFDDPYQEDYQDIRTAYNKVRDASLILGREVDKRIAEGSAFLDTAAIEEVRALLHEAIDLLLGGKYQEMLDQVNDALGGIDISQPLNLQISGSNSDWSSGGSSWNVGNYSANWSQPGNTAAGNIEISSLSDYYSLLDNLGKALYNIDHSDQPLEGSVSFDFDSGTWSNSITGQGSTAVRALIDDMITQLNPVFQAISYIQLVKVDLAQMSEKTPLRNSQFQKFFSILEGTAQELDDVNADSYQGAASTSDVMQNLIGDLASEEMVTLQSVNNKCRAAEASITMLNFNLSTISAAGGLIESMIRPIFAILKDVRTDMREFLNSTGFDDRAGAGALAGMGEQGFGSQVWDVGTSKLRWSTKLEVAKSSLTAFTTTLQLPGGEPTNWMDSTTAEQVEARWDSLVAYLENEGLDIWMSPDKYPESQPAEVAFEMLQQIPSSVFLELGWGNRGGVVNRGATNYDNNFASQVMPSIDQIAAGEPARGLLLAYMQELKSQFQMQFGIDQYVYNECKAIRGLIEQHPGFQSMMSWWSSLANSMSDGPFGNLGPELMEGKLDTLMSATANTAAILENPLYRNLGPCIKGGIVPPDIIAGGIGLDPVQIPDLSAQLNADKAALAVTKLQDSVLQEIAGVTDNKQWQEFNKKKRELMINMNNQASQLQDIITQLGVIYSIVGG